MVTLRVVGLPRQDAIPPAGRRAGTRGTVAAGQLAGAGGCVRLSTRRLAGRQPLARSTHPAPLAPTSNPHFCRRSLADGAKAAGLGQRAPRRATPGRQPAPASLAGPLAGGGGGAGDARGGRAHPQRRAHRADYRRAGLYPHPNTGACLPRPG